MKALEVLKFDAGELARKYPPRWRHKHKELVYRIAKSSGFADEGEIVYARWHEEKPPDEIDEMRSFLIRPGVFEYAPPTSPSDVEWHLNFADPELFVAYGSSLLAQDELQVAEHPILGSLTEALRAAGNPPQTVEDRKTPTPVTITGVQRRCAIDTMPNRAAGRPYGLYGNAFADADASQVEAATKPLAPPTISHILAMAALPGGYGTYLRSEIAYILNTAYTGFTAARQESLRLVPTGSRTVIHTGFWGCGAFGGNRTLMTILQSLAADLAQVDVVFWAFNAEGVRVVENARELYVRCRETTSSTAELVSFVLNQRYEWGVSDGN